MQPAYQSIDLYRQYIHQNMLIFQDQARVLYEGCIWSSYEHLPYSSKINNEIERNKFIISNGTTQGNWTHYQN
jgi:hypothetical protein